MQAISKTMTAKHAMAILKANPQTTPALLELAESASQWSRS
jgi:hypothetical protein